MGEHRSLAANLWLRYLSVDLLIECFLGLDIPTNNNTQHSTKQHSTLKY